MREAAQHFRLFVFLQKDVNSVPTIKSGDPQLPIIKVPSEYNTIFCPLTHVCMCA